MKKIFLVLLIVCSISACGHLGEQFNGLKTPNQDEALIYYYRPFAFMGSGVSIAIAENKQDISKIPVNGYYVHKATQGWKDVEMKMYGSKIYGSKNLMFWAENGQTYFIKIYAKEDGKFELRIMQQELAEQELQKCRVIEQK